jgi:hypothetical protein
MALKSQSNLMKTITTLLCGALLCSLTSFAQISFSGSSTALSTPVNAPAITIDNTLTITSNTSFDGARVSVSSNFSSGDVLTYTGSLPAGVTASYNSTTGVLTFTGTATAAAYETLLRTATFATSSTNALQRTILFNIGSTIGFSGNNHLYEFVSSQQSWYAAKAAAESRTLYGLQGYLATVTSAGENNFIHEKIAADGWIGASDDASYINSAVGSSLYTSQANAEGRWYWVTGPEKGTQITTDNAPGSGYPPAFNGALQQLECR